MTSCGTVAMRLESHYAAMLNMYEAEKHAQKRHAGRTQASLLAIQKDFID